MLASNLGYRNGVRAGLLGQWRGTQRYIVLSDHFKSGQQLSLQNRPTGVAVQD